MTPEKSSVFLSICYLKIKWIMVTSTVFIDWWWLYTIQKKNPFQML